MSQTLQKIKEPSVQWLCLLWDWGGVFVGMGPVQGCRQRGRPSVGLIVMRDCHLPSPLSPYNGPNPPFVYIESGDKLAGDGSIP